MLDAIYFMKLTMLSPRHIAWNPNGKLRFLSSRLFD